MEEELTNPDYLLANAQLYFMADPFQPIIGSLIAPIASRASHGKIAKRTASVSTQASIPLPATSESACTYACKKVPFDPIKRSSRRS